MEHGGLVPLKFSCHRRICEILNVFFEHLKAKRLKYLEYAPQIPPQEHIPWAMVVHEHGLATGLHRREYGSDCVPLIIVRKFMQQHERIGEIILGLIREHRAGGIAQTNPRLRIFPELVLVQLHLDKILYSVRLTTSHRKREIWGDRK